VKVRVREGNVRIRYVDVIRETPEIIILEIGVAEPEAVPHTWIPGRDVKISRPGAANPTEITFDFDRGTAGTWDQSVSAPIRYMIDVAIWRRPDQETRVTIHKEEDASEQPGPPAKDETPAIAGAETRAGNTRAGGTLGGNRPEAITPPATRARILRHLDPSEYDSQHAAAKRALVITLGAACRKALPRVTPAPPERDSPQPAAAAAGGARS
jgi:hypothetical protein